MRQVVQAVVIVLILETCIGLVLIGVAKVREAANQVQCRTNLRQIAIATANYENTNGRFPAAAMPNETLPAEKRLSWLVDIMPYVEANDIYGRLDRKKGWDAEENRFAALLIIRCYQCPGYPEKPPVSTLSPSHYIGLAGVGEGAADLPPGDPRAGFFGYERALRKRDLIRGVSETAMATETSAAEGGWTAAGAPTVRGYDPATAHFGGNHRHLCNVLFADGSVRPIDVGTSEAEWRRLVVLADEAPPE
jgi:prepilin-type processing-associated H-X9-DG protein